ncbi:unnamed protein product, partial [Iphiclides podalirius]
MRLLLVLSCVIAIHSAALNGTEEKPEVITINGAHYVKEVLKTGIERPYSLAIDAATDTLFFSYTLSDSEEVLRSAKIDLESGQFSDIEGLQYGFTQTVDQEHHVPYIGTSKGIYKYDYGNNNATLYAAPEADIWEVYYNGVLFYSDFPSRDLYTVRDGVSARFSELNETRRGGGCAVLYKSLDLGEEIRAIAADAEGRVHVCCEDGIYKVDKARAALERVFFVDDAYGLAFDRRNWIVYADAKSLAYLKPKQL